MSRMFLNQVSSRELFTGGREKRNSQLSDNSQLMYQNSQLDLSENSQDATFSQQLSGENSGSESQGRRIFDRFMTKRTNSETSFKSTPAKPPFSSGNRGYNPGMSLPGKQQLRPNFQQQILMNKTKAKDRDDRDMLGTVVNTVKDYSDEVRNSIKICQQNMEQLSDTSNEKFSAMANSIFDMLAENFDRIYKTMKEKEENRNKIIEMEKEIILRDARIGEMKNMMDRQQAEKEKVLLDNLKSVIQCHHEETSVKLDKLEKAAACHNDNQNIIIDGHRQQWESIEKHHQQIQNIQSERYQDIKKGIISELQQLRQDLENHKNQLEDFYSTQLSTIQYKSMKEIQYQIKSDLDKHAQQTRDDSREICNYQIGQLKDISESQQEANERFLKTQLQGQAVLRKHENEQLAKQVEMITLKRGNEVDSLPQNSERTQKCNRQENNSLKMQRQLDEMFMKYNEEFAKLREKIGIETSKSKHLPTANLSNFNNCDTTLSVCNQSSKIEKNQYLKESQQPDMESERHSQVLTEKNCNIHFNDNNRKTFALVSPGYRGEIWNSRSVFYKPNPSPVAAVLPQPQNPENYKIPETSDTRSNRRGKRRKKTYGRPSRKSKRLSNKLSETENDTSDVSQNSQVVRERDILMNEVQRENAQKLYSSEKFGSSKLRNTEMNTNSQKMYISNIFPPPQVKDYGISGNLNYNKEMNSKRGVLCFKVPENSLSSENVSKINLSNIQKREGYGISRGFPCSTDFKDRCDTQYKNVFPVRPNTYSVGTLKKSTPSVISSVQSIRCLPQNKSKAEPNAFSQYSNLRQKSGSIYDFKDSPVNIRKNDSKNVDKNSSLSESSRESSPSLSITKIMIQRKVKNHKRHDQFTKDQKNGMQEKIVCSGEMSSDFLSTPNMDGHTCSSSADQWESQSLMSGYKRSGEKRKLFNFDLGKELMAIKKAFKV